MRPQQEVKGLDSALLLTFTMMIVPETLMQAVSVNRRYLLCRETERPVAQGFLLLVLWTFWNLLSPFVWGCPVHHRMFSGITILCPLSANRTPAALMTPKMSLDITKCLLEGKGRDKSPLSRTTATEEQSAASHIVSKNFSNGCWKEKLYISLPKRTT